MATTYGPYALANRAALKASDKAFVIPVYGEEVSYLARPYIEQSRAMIAQRIATELSGTERQDLLTWLKPFGLENVFRN